MTTNNIQCNLCGAKIMESYLEKGPWQIVRCLGCGLIFVKNPPDDDELTKEYGELFFQDGQKAPINGFNIHNNPTYKNAQRRLKTIRRLGPSNGKLLDIGCATGIFLKTASTFYDGSGMDISRYATDSAVRNFGLKVFCGSILDLEFEPRSIDVITMWDVIEHVRDPRKYMERIHQAMDPRGLLVMSTGNIDSCMSKIQKKNWHLMIPPVHLYYFNPHTISRLLEQTGFKVIKIVLDGQYTNVGYLFRKLKRLHATSKLLSVTDKIAKKLQFERMNIYLNLYDVMTVYARPKHENEVH